MKKILPVVLIVIALANTLMASGFQINEHGAKAMAMAGAFTAVANDASAVYFNPAGITQLSGTNFSAGVTLISPSASFTGAAPLSGNKTDLESQVFTPFNVYYTQELSEQWFIGLGVSNPYGLGTKWSNDWEGRYLAVETLIETFTFNPVVAYKVNEQFSVSVGASISYGKVLIDRMVGLPPVPTGNPESPIMFLPDVDTKMEGNAWGYGFSAAILYKPTKCLSLGLSFRSEIKYAFEGDAESNPANVLVFEMANGPIEADLTVPMNLTVGAAYQASESFLMSFDFQYIGWTSYEKLEVTFNEWSNPLTGSNISSAERNYNNSFITRLGMDYKANNDLAIRGGIYFDKSPVDDEYMEPTNPDSDRIGFNIGLGYKFTEKFSIDFAYLYLHFMEREVTNSKVVNPDPKLTVANGGQPVYFNGTYQPVAHLLGLNLNYSL